MMHHMLQFQRRWLWIPLVVIALSTVQIVFWAMDRKSPFEVIGSHVDPVKPGTHATMLIDVRRDLDRTCRVDTLRWLEVNGYRTYLEPLSFEAADIRELGRVSPHKVKLFIYIPQWFPYGPANYRASLSYECNPLHKIWPIIYQQTIPFEVLR